MIIRYIRTGLIKRERIHNLYFFTYFYNLKEILKV